MHMEPGENQVVRRLGAIGKAKYQTIKVTGVLVLCFIVCSMPYYSMGFWYVTADFIMVSLQIWLLGGGLTGQARRRQTSG